MTGTAAAVYDVHWRLVNSFSKDSKGDIDRFRHFILVIPIEKGVKNVWTGLLLMGSVSGWMVKPLRTSETITHSVCWSDLLGQVRDQIIFLFPRKAFVTCTIHYRGILVHEDTSCRPAT